VEEFDQEIALAGARAQQLFDLGTRARVDLAAFRCLPRPASRRLGLVDNVHAGARKSIKFADDTQWTSS
jgi:hypothetical protein